MKKSLSLLLALLLCLSLLAGCAKDGAPVQTPAPSEEPAATPEPTPEPTPKPHVEPTGEREGMWDLIPFDEMPYERPDPEDLRVAVEAVGEALDAGADYETLEPLLDACEDAYDVFYTMYSIAFIRSCQDMTDEYYSDEYAWLDEKSSEIDQMMEKLYYRCGMSDMALELEEKYFWPGFAEEYADDSNAFYSDEMVALLQEESNLIAEYRALVASPTVVLPDGTEVDYFTALEERTGMAYLELITCFYEQYNPQLAEIYIKLVKNRQQQAVVGGYDSYEALAFDHVFERDYTPEQAEGYLNDLKTVIVPLYIEVDDSGRYWYLDEGSVDAARLEEILRYGVTSMGQEVLDTYEFMVKYRLCDLEHSPLKAEMSFKTYLSAYEVPFLFMDAGGNLGDITTFSHEFGHYLDGFLNFEEDETIDLAEVYSQAMELLMLTRLDAVLSDHELETLYQMKMLDILNMYVQQGAFAEFEHIIYSTDPDKLTPEYVNGVFLDMCGDYGFLVPGYEGVYSMMWIDITHFFEQPFYVITYPVSNDIAMQIFQLERENPGAGLDKFMEMLPRVSPNLLESSLGVGLESPFAPGRLQQVAEIMHEILMEDKLSDAA